MNHLLTPIVLAAGASSRMGTSKALLDFGGRTALDRVLDTAAGFGKAVVVLGSGAEEIEKRCELGRATVVRNSDWAKGMTSSLQTGLKALPENAEGFFVWPVDLPLVPAETLRELGMRFWILRQNRRRPIVIPKASRRGHPVLFDRVYADEVLALSSGEPPRTVVDRHAAQVEEIPAGDVTVRDLDTPEDYARAAKR
ncbi:MAG: putative MobA-like [Planctomycetota bacterium]|nr:MAG: putative MobA-like [Planctomycetota bacterium]